MDFIALDMRPVSIVSGEGFTQPVELLEPGYCMPKCDTVMHAITSKYNNTKKIALEKIKSCTAVSFTTDIWTSKQMESYMTTVTARFISEDWRLHSLVLETKVLEVSHTAANIAE